MKYLMPIFDYLSTLVDQGTKDSLTRKVSVVIIIFSAFIGFLILSLLVCIKYGIEYLKKQTVTNKILIKMIPYAELHNINKRQQQGRQEHLI
jgi:hypothetical protein